ncbi:DUF3597 domain-containing protein [Roseateles koreensis]|uniref:DUF3597 domain-containing protein n=1 Tax=Roseateles koreensis TaxID=2987526 RepID=A0ABT5KXH2_9BURK|nr:DUF3597 domain-containing protein [Roseateles koreensis]MDC8786531.1 DUF3597 domain-containing protein [Roseateles koreensis]
MSFFGKILDKLGLGTKDAAAATPAASDAPAPDNAGISATAPAVPTPSVPVAITEVDVETQLNTLAAANAEKLNWKVSIVDLLKLLDLDSSLTARKALATELACPTEKMGDSAQMNMWLHKTVLQKLAANGGKVPSDLL